MNYSNLVEMGYADGPGVRVSLFVSGCTHACPGCFNSVAFDFQSGEEFTILTLCKIVELLRNPYITGLSILGGDPLMERNYTEVLEIVRQVKSVYPEKTIWVWTGYKMEYVQRHYPELFDHIDALVDGKYVQGKAAAQYRGSDNQKVWYKYSGSSEFVVVPEDQIRYLK